MQYSRPMARASKIPGPSRWRLLRDLPRIRRNMLDYLVELAAQHGDTVLLPLRHPTYLLRDPADIKHVLVTNGINYHKAGGLRVGKHLLGEGLISSEEPLHGRQRRLLQPMFHKQVIAGFADLMTRSTGQHIGGWKAGAVIDLALEMMDLTISIGSQALFGFDLHREGRELGLAFAEAQRLITVRQRRLQLPLWVPTLLNIRYRRVLAQIDSATARIIASRRAVPEADRPGDLLTMMLAVRYEDGAPMPDKQLRDEMITLILAGHETVANTLNWTWYLLSQHPDVEAELVAEWKAVLGGRSPVLSDLPNLRFTEMVLAEAMRLYPPAWTLARQAVAADTLPGGLKLRAKDEVLLMQYVSHRNPEFFPDPLKFDPRRFAPENRDKIPSFAYYPFGGGSRYCLGEAFARLEAAIVLATIGQRFQMKLLPGHPVALEPLITLRLKFGLKMELAARS